ncbi:MAG TPA: PGPGW domain-containing protein [Candidatus Saccharimonadales bacterium]|nr:PGPGW domain-containing protein [Candidatus Saccharimonadales bacterium]
MESLKRNWKRIPAAVRKPLVLMVGVAIIVAGLAMLVLPGPGWAAIFLGFAVLATEFAAAEKVRDWMVAQFKYLARQAKKAWKKSRNKPQA